jgi:hypothetical protein
MRALLGYYPSIYDIEGQKDGKPFNFVVGPRGKLRGMEN